jgi:uncharacterized protein (TIGR02145 family)
MGINISSNFNLNTARPLDSRTVKADLTARDAIVPTLRYSGLRVYVTAEDKNYQLIGGITNLDWIEVMTGLPTNSILEWTGLKYEPYSAAASGVFDVGVVAPTGSTRLNYGGNFHATQLYEGATRVSVTGHTHTGVYEPVLGNPDVTGKVLSSTTGGVRSWVTPGSLITAAALTKTDDTNVTLTLGGFASTALLRATSITAGWTGKLADSRIASADAWNAKADGDSVISIVGTPAQNEVTIWNSATSLRADPNFTWDGTTLIVSGNILATGEISAFSSGTPPNWWDSMPYATNTTIGGIIYDSAQFEKVGDLFTIKDSVLVPASHTHAWADITSGIPGYFLPNGEAVANQIAIWNSPTTLQGLPGLTYDGTTLTITGNISATGEISAFSAGVPINWWNDLPVATTSVLGGVKIGDGLKSTAQGVESVDYNTTRSRTGIITDYDGNEYHTVIIGNQEWIVENLRVTHSADGTDIPLVTDPIAWAALTTKGMCYYNNDINNAIPYGALYNWYAVDATELAYFERDGVIDLGWRVPSPADYERLRQFLEGWSSLAGVHLKETGTLHWSTANGKNTHGFTALPGGVRVGVDGTFVSMGTNTDFWTNYSNAGYATEYFLGDVDTDLYVDVLEPTLGLSIRCMRTVSTNIVNISTLGFANPLICDASVYKNFVCNPITGNTVITLQNYSDGDKGIIYVTMDNVGGYTVSLFGFTALLQDGGTYMSVIDTTALATTYIEYHVLDNRVFYKLYAEA